MISTTADMRVWVKALATGELISPELQEERLVGAPLSDGPEYDEYAVGIGSLESWWGHTGDGLCSSSLVMYNLDSDYSIAIFVNMSDAIDTSDEGSGCIVHVLTILMREYVAISAGERRSFIDVGTLPREGGPLASETVENSTGLRTHSWPKNSSSPAS